MASHSDTTPRKLMMLIHWGLKDKVMAANIPWLCATCNTCTVRCPRGIEVPKVMEAVRLLTLRENKNYIEPFEIPEERLEQLPQIALVGCFRKHTS